MKLDDLILSLEAARMAYGGDIETTLGERWSRMQIDSPAEWARSLRSIDFGVVRAHSLQQNVLVVGR